MNFSDLTYDICRCYVRENRSSLGEANAERILGWIRSRSLPHLASCVNGSEEAYASLDRLRVLRQVEAFFKKNAIFSEPTVTLAAAESSFLRAERLCRITNRRMDHYYLQRDRLDPDLQLWLSCSEEYISKVLGSFDDFLGELPKLVRFTSGATSANSRRNSAPHKKVSLQMQGTKGAAAYIMAMSKFFGYDSMRVRTTFANRVEFVPKSWKTDRTIACEPEGNLPFQLAFDSYSKKRLRYFGIDLSSQTRNQEMAREASVSGKYATLDLSMASDTLAFNTVAWLLPQPWFKFLRDVRTPFGRTSKGLIKYAKFSSMGNGATFALETLIFASACYAVGSKNFSVYGDDIVIETELFPDLLRYLRFLGFIPNVDKSFYNGPFRESCGLDCYAGRDVTPFYLRSWSGLKALLCHNVNGLVSIAKPDGELGKLLVDLVNDFHLPLVPENEDSMSGVHIFVHHAYARKLIKVKGGIPRFRAYKPRSASLRVQTYSTYFLWHLNRFRREKKNEFDYLETSTVPAFDHRYVRKWTLWDPTPEVGASGHRFWWSEFLIPLLKSRD